MTAPTHQHIPDPGFWWPALGWWCTAIGAVISIALFVVPSFTELALLKRLLVCVALVFTPAVLLVLLHLGRRDRAVALRARGYNGVVTSLEDANFELDRANSVINALVQDRQERNSLRIEYCYVFDDRPMIALKRKRGFRVKAGDSLTVVAQDIGRVLGEFEVTEDAGDRYIARSSGPVDALWLGYMKQAGMARSEPPPHALAMRLSVEEDADDKENTESTT